MSRLTEMCYQEVSSHEIPPIFESTKHFQTLDQEKRRTKFAFSMKLNQLLTLTCEILYQYWFLNAFRQLLLLLVLRM